MASTQTPREIMAALIDGRTPTKKSKTVLVGYHDSPLQAERTARPTIFSYGNHFPMAIRSEQEDVWYFNMARYGVTTAVHQAGVRQALMEAGYTVNSETPEVVKDRNGRLFARYARRGEARCTTDASM